MRLVLIAATVGAGAFTWTSAVVYAQRAGWPPVVMAIGVTVPLVAAVPLVTTTHIRHRGLAWACFAVAATDAALVSAASRAPAVAGWYSGAFGAGLAVLFALFAALLVVEWNHPQEEKR